jgi:hypothetical protein
MTSSELIAQWLFRNHRVQLAHYESARYFQRLHLWLGLPAIALSSIVGTSIFASLSGNQAPEVQILAGVLSLVAAALMGLQTFLKHSEQAEKHRLAGARFASLKHRIELLQSFPPTAEDDIRVELQAIEKAWARLREESPTLPTRIWRNIEKTAIVDDMARP